MFGHGSVHINFTLHFFLLLLYFVFEMGDNQYDLWQLKILKTV